MASGKRRVSGVYLVSRLQEELDRVIAGVGEAPRGDEPATDLAPPIDVFETAGSVVLVLEAPGLTTDDLEIETAGNRLTIRGRRSAAAAEDGPLRFHCMERGRGDFRRAIELVGALDTHRARARLGQGLLRVEIPKVDDRRLASRRLTIERDEA